MQEVVVVDENKVLNYSIPIWSSSLHYCSEGISALSIITATPKWFCILKETVFLLTKCCYSVSKNWHGWWSAAKQTSKHSLRNLLKMLHPCFLHFMCKHVVAHSQLAWRWISIGIWNSQTVITTANSAQPEQPCASSILAQNSSHGKCKHLMMMTMSQLFILVIWTSKSFKINKNAVLTDCQ